MNDLNLRIALARTLKIALLLSLAIFITGCGCGVLSKDAWSGGGNCAKQQRAEYDTREQQSQRELATFKKRADDGDAKAQFAMGQFHVFEQHPNSLRAIGLGYFDKASRQGDLQAQRIFATESLKDCQAKAFKLGPTRLNGPQYAPYCSREWQALETLATQTCVRSSASINSSIQVAIGEAFDDADKSDEADFWYLVALTSCVTSEERATGRISGFTARHRADGRPQEVRGAMWLGVRGRGNFPTIPLATPEVEAKAKARLAMLQAKVARSGIWPMLASTTP